MGRVPGETVQLLVSQTSVSWAQQAWLREEPFRLGWHADRSVCVWCVCGGECFNWVS